MHVIAHDRRQTLADQLVQLVGPDFGGKADRRRMMMIKMLAHQVMRMAGDEYGEEKALAVIRWSAIACSPDRARPWGQRNAERFAFENACRLRRHILDGGQAPTPDRTGGLL